MSAWPSSGLSQVSAYHRFALSITLLPSLLFLLRPSASGMSEVGYARLAPLESLLHRQPSAVLGLGGIAAIASAALLPLCVSTLTRFISRVPR